MADLPGYIKHYTVQPNIEIRKLWADQQICEKECRIKRLETDAEELIRGRLKIIQADVLMLKREVAKLYELRDTLDKYNNDQIIDVKQIAANASNQEM